MGLRVVVVWWIVCLLWSSTFFFIRLGLQDIPPFTFASMRLAIAAAVLVPLALSRREWRAWSRRDLAYGCGTGLLLLGVNYGLIFWGAQFVPSGLVAILQSGTPVVALALGWLLGSEAVNPRKLLAVTLGVIGVAAIVGAEARASGGRALAGAAAVFGGSVCVAFAYVWTKTYAQHLPRTSLTALQAVAGLVPLALLGVAVERTPAPAQWPVSAWAALLYLGLVASVLAFWLNYWLLERMDASVMLLMGVAEVPIAIALGAVIFGERLPAGTLAGAGCVLLGVIAGLKGNSNSQTAGASERQASTADS